MELDIPGVVEKFGVEIGRAEDWPPMAGRILALIMLHDGPVSMRELGERLGASAGSISGCTRLLDTGGVIRRVKMPGSRQTGYEFREDAWLACLHHEVGALTRLRTLAGEASEWTTEIPSYAHERFAEMHRYYTYLTAKLAEAEQEFAAILAEESAARAVADQQA